MVVMNKGFLSVPKKKIQYFFNKCQKNIYILVMANEAGMMNSIKRLPRSFTNAENFYIRTILIKYNSRGKFKSHFQNQLLSFHYFCFQRNFVLM